jgi:NADH-quinone oxidoreductase subunit M
MILVWLIVVPLAGGVLAWIVGRQSPRGARWVSLLTLAINLVFSLWLWVAHAARMGTAGSGPWLEELRLTWIPQLGISFHLAMDGLSLLLVVLTAFLGMAAVVSSWNEVTDRVGFFHFNILWTLAGITGVFLALDLFLFYFFWEVMLVPTYFLFLWGYERRVYAGVKFFIFTLVSGLLMLLAIIGLVFVHGQATGTYTFDYTELLGTQMPGTTAMWLMLGFFIGFGVKLPVVPFHSWLPDAYTQSPTAATVILAGIMAKTGAYGLLRFVVPLFPGAALQFAPVAMTLAVIGILYGALLAFGQTDLKRLVAYTSVGHMGFVLLGVFAWNQLALQGAVIEIIAHGISTGALFILVGALIERVHTRDMGRLGGLWGGMPRLGGVTLLFVLALIGLPGMGNFVAEFLILVGTFRVSVVAAVFASIGIVLAAVYGLWMIQRTYQGPVPGGLRLPDLSPREGIVTAVLVAAIVLLGLYPQPVIDSANHGLNNLMKAAGTADVAGPQMASGEPVPPGGER